MHAFLSPIGHDIGKDSKVEGSASNSVQVMGDTGYPTPPAPTEDSELNTIAKQINVLALDSEEDDTNSSVNTSTKTLEEVELAARIVPGGADALTGQAEPVNTITSATSPAGLFEFCM